MPLKYRSDTLKKLGLKIKQARQDASLTQDKLAEFLGYKDRVSISLIENGRKSAYKHLEKLAKITGKTVSWFLEDDTERKKLYWKAAQYDHWTKELERLFSMSMKKFYTEMDGAELSAELSRLGITDPEFQALFKAVPFLTKEEKKKILQSFRPLKPAYNF
jgi:transcriptional regulator with XRE-family HTH domain